jgi:hypothetical protein
MAIVGGRPEEGLRLELERPRAGGPPWIYDGDAVTKDARFPMRAVVAEDGGVTVTLDAAAPAGVAERARLIVRTAYKHAKADDASAPPPRRIVRWREA